MEFAYLFIFSFIVGLVCYWFTEKWWLASAILSVVLLVLLLISGDTVQQQLFILASGLPIIFVGGLLAAYVIQLRNFDDLESQKSEEVIEKNDEPKKT